MKIGEATRVGVEEGQLLTRAAKAHLEMTAAIAADEPDPVRDGVSLAVQGLLQAGAELAGTHGTSEAAAVEGAAKGLAIICSQQVDWRAAVEDVTRWVEEYAEGMAPRIREDMRT